MIASGGVSAAGSASSAVASHLISAILTGNFNPEYNKLHRKKMRYIQQKYALAYGGGQGGEDPYAIIQKIGSFYISIKRIYEYNNGLIILLKILTVNY